MIREAAVAGQFYPASPDKLRQMITAMVDDKATIEDVKAAEEVKMAPIETSQLEETVKKAIVNMLADEDSPISKAIEAAVKKGMTFEAAVQECEKYGKLTPQQTERIKNIKQE